MRRGFSLVELSIVLVILGLLTGGILAGQSLIRAASLRSVVTEYQRYVTATQTFREKYMAIPGDMANATRFWGRLNSNADCVTNSAASVTTPGTCDGSGNGNVGQGSGANKSAEQFQFWRQLSLAGLIEGTYTGLSDSAATLHVVDLNCPASRLAPAGWTVLTRGNSVGSAGDYFAGDYGTLLTPIQDYESATIFRPEEAWNIDIKLDDGRAGRGKILAKAISTCTDAGSGAGSQNDLDADYLLTSTSSTACGLYFTRAF
jgi:prepilin-type N-terminal cleavage/methylation domain-containing protein